MRIIFDQGTPVPLRQHLHPHSVATAFEVGWATMKNGELLNSAENLFDLLITTDQQMRYQHDVFGRKLAIIVLMTTRWPRLLASISTIQAAVEDIKPGEYLEVSVD